MDVSSLHRGDAGIIRLLLDAGADPTIPNRYGETALDFAGQAPPDVRKLFPESPSPEKE